MGITSNSAFTVEALYEDPESGQFFRETRSQFRHWRHRARCGKRAEKVDVLFEGGGNSGLLAELFDICQEPDGDSAKDFAHRMDRLSSLNVSQLEEIQELKTMEGVLKKTLQRERLTKYLILLMSRSFDVKVILEIISRQIGLFLKADRCLVTYYNRSYVENPDSAERLALLSQFCGSEKILPVQEDTIPHEIVEFTREAPWLIYNTNGLMEMPEPIREYTKRYNIQSALGIQIQYRDSLYGQLVLHQCTYPRQWTREEIELLEVLAMHIGSALYQANLYQAEKLLRQEAEEANRQKSKILSFVAHDLKNPLAGILRFSEILQMQRQALPAESKQIVSFIAEGAGQMQGMITNILDKARLENGKVIPDIESIELPAFIEQLKPTLNALASMRNIQFDIEIEPQLVQIQADPVHFRQMIINLLSNAVKYNRPDGKVHLKFYTEENKQVLVIEMRDTGIGIPLEKIPSLFVEYYRTDPSPSNSVEGTGLGLAFIKKLVELHGGRLSVESRVNVGSTFKVMLPLAV